MAIADLIKRRLRKLTRVATWIARVINMIHPDLKIHILLRIFILTAGHIERCDHIRFTFADQCHHE